MIFLLAIVCWFAPALSEAKLVQILHTNDIHSYFLQTDHNPNVGGYGRLKSIMNKYVAWGDEHNMSTIKVDAGDFMEGNLFYMADYGRKSFQMHNLLGYDVATIGNHDYLMGTDELEDILTDTPPNFAFLGANFWANGAYPQINRTIVPFHEMDVDGIKIAFLGLTTNELFYKWRVYNGGIKRPYKIGKRWAKKLKQRGNDIVIALSHLGRNSDHKLVKKAPDIDLVIGGHSHHFLYEPEYEENKYGKMIPIVQAGSHAEVIGRLILDIQKNGEYKLVKYELIPVVGEEKDPLVENFVQEAVDDLHAQYGREWLETVVGHSDLGPGGARIWNTFITDSMMEALGADMSLHTPSMSGPNYPVGKIDRYQILNSHPRFFDMEDLHGWKIYRAKINGALLRTVFKLVMNFKLPLNIVGIDFKWKVKKNGKLRVRKMRINGRRVSPFKNYTMAIPEGVIRGARALYPFLASIIFRKSNVTNKTVIQAIEEKLSREKVISMDYIEEYDHRMQSVKGLKGGRLSRTFYPGAER